MTFIINLGNYIKLEKVTTKEVKSINRNIKTENIGIIDVDYSLLRYIEKEIGLDDIAINNCGYVTIKKEDGAQKF